MHIIKPRRNDPPPFSAKEMIPFLKDEQLQKHLPRMFSLIKRQSDAAVVNDMYAGYAD